MTTLREKMKEQMLLIGLSESTQRVYLRVVTQLRTHFNKSPAKLSMQQIRGYLLYLKSKQLSSSSYNVEVCALRFFYRAVLRQTLTNVDLPTTRASYKLPETLSQDEVGRIIKSTGNIKNRALLIITYGAGLRVSEVVNLRIQDIDSDRMTLHIRCSKSRKDRYVILSPVVYKALCDYWKPCQFKDYIFPSPRNQNKPITTRTASQIFSNAKIEAGIQKDCGIHALRHAFATHLLEAGTDIFTIKALLGHASIKSTSRYLSLVPNRHKNLRSPIDKLAL